MNSHAMSAEATRQVKHPAGDYECQCCHQKNGPGEYFPLTSGFPFPYDLARLCSACARAHLLNQIDKRRLAVSESPYADPQETQGTDGVICPYCGYHYSDSWEFAGTDGEATCESCDRAFHYERTISVSYSTRRTEGQP